MKAKPTITKPDTSKKGDPKNRRTESNYSTIKPAPPSSRHNSSNPRSINPRFNLKVIPEKYLLNPNDFEPFNKDPVTGGFGIINFVRNKATGKEYAAKTSHRKTTPQERKFVLRELNILMKVQHPTIIHFEGFSFQDFQGYDNITIFIDYMEKGTLSDILEKEQHSLLPLDFDNTKRQMILVGISRGMMILHKNNVIHRDLKPENVLLDNDYKPLITDFGLSKIFTSQNSQSQSMATCGTYAYMAPEVIEGNRFSTKADVYSFGILMYEVVTGTSAMKSMTNNKPFNARKFMNSVVSGGRPTFQDEEIKPGLRRMIEQCWSNNPDERPTFSELYSKLSLADEEFYIDNDNNICEAVFKLEDEYEDNEDSLMPTNFCFDYVDFDELFLYIDEINEETNSSSNDEQLKSLKNEINELKTHAKKVENENTALKNDVSNIKNENKQLKNDISELKEIISNLKNEQQKIANMNICNQIEKPSEEELQDECIELAEKAKSEKLTSIELPRFLQKVPDSLFKDYDELKTVKIPFSVTEIGHHAFADCSSLSQVKIPSSLTKIGEYAFIRCSSLTQITIPSSVTEIRKYAFNGCSSLEKIKIPSSVTSIGANAFGGCSSLEQITIPSSLTVLEFSLLSECSSLTQITIPSSVTEIGRYVFEKCSSLTQVTIPSSVTKIGECAFIECSSLSQITIPSSVSEIDPSFLTKCSNIKEITITRCGEERVKYHEDKFLLHKKDPSGETFDILLFANLDSKKVIIPSFIKTIGSLSGCSSMTQITIPSSVTKIGHHAFYGCSLLTDIKIPSSVTQIGNYAFYECSSLLQITFPSSVTEIGQYAFDKCQSLNNISIPSSITIIRFSAFSNCSSLAKIAIPSSVTIIDDYAFQNCSSLEHITIPSSVTSIGSMAFEGCTSLTQVTIPSSVTKIKRRAFADCSSLTQVTIPSSLTDIKADAFASNTKVIKA